MSHASHICTYCSRIINVTKGFSHAFPYEGKKYCTWCYNRLFFSDADVKFSVPYKEFLRIADPQFIVEMIQKAHDRKTSEQKA